MAIIRRVTIIFGLFLVIVVLLANTGRLGFLFNWLYYIPYSDKLGHFLLMGTLALLASLGFPTTRTPVFSLKVLKSSLIITGLVTVEEMSQVLFADRTASMLDLAASLSGIILLGEAGAWLKPHLFHHPKPVEKNHSFTDR